MPDQGVHLPVCGIGEKHRLDIGVLVADVDHAVFLFVGPRQFVFFDFAVRVVLEMAGRDQPVLSAAAHGLGIDVIMFFVILH